MLETIESRVINDWLATQANANCGVDTVTPLFRLVWSDDLTELRKGVIDICFEGRVVATEERIDRFPKYSYIKERWILEWWQSGYNPELPESQYGSYEPIYVFDDKKRKALPLNLTVVQFLVNRLLRPSRSAQLIHSDIEFAMQAREEELDAFTEDAMDTSVIASLIHSGSGGLVPANYDVQSPNLRRLQ